MSRRARSTLFLRARTLAGEIDGAVVQALAEIAIEVALEFPKPLTVEVLPAADVVVTMVMRRRMPDPAGPGYLDWRIQDPAGRELAEVRRIRQDIADHQAAAQAWTAGRYITIRLSHNRWVWYGRVVSVTALPVISPRERQSGGCCAAVAEPDLTPEAAAGLAEVVKALADPTRLRIVDTLRKAAPEALCQCEFVPLFDMSQPALAKHLKVLVNAGVLGSERRGLWAYYFISAESRMEELIAWLT
jgi:ArsR family transcriptional regulator